MRVVVVGGGITGLAAAFQLVQTGGSEVTLLEAEPRLGGKIRTEEFEGRAVEAGPDAFLARVPDAVDLCRELGLAEDLVAPAARQAWLWSRGRLRALPEDLVLGVPSDLVGLLRSQILSPAGVLRAAADLVLPPTRPGRDASVGSLVGRRFGHQTVARLVDPLLGGIHAGRADALSVEATAPQLASVARSRRSLLLGLRAQRRSNPPADGPIFLAPKGGLVRLVDRLATEVEKGARIATGCAVTSLSAPDGVAAREYRLETSDGPLDADRVILAVPAAAAAGLVKSHSPAAASELRSIRHASVALALLAYPASSFPHPLPGSGVLVPRTEGRLMTALSCGSAKWPDWAEPGSVVLRVSAGRVDDARPDELDDDALIGQLHGELEQLLGVRHRPVASRVARWPDAFPQYEVGHQDRVARIERALLVDLPGVVVAGAALRGIGLPACIAQGRSAADRVLEVKQERPPSVTNF